MPATTPPPTASSPRTAAHPDSAFTRRKSLGPVLLAVSETSRAISTATMAAQIADHWGVPLLVVTVLEPLPIYTGPNGMEPLPLLLEQERWDAQKQAVTDHIERALGAHAWKLHMRSGSISREVSAAAEELGASLIVVGSAPHRRRDSIVAGVRAAQILRSAPCPVLSVAPEANGLPRTILAGTDFGPPSLYAAEVALSVAGDNARMTLLNIPLPFNVPAKQEKSGAVIGGNVDDLLATARGVLEPSRPTHVTIDVQKGDGIIVDTMLARADAMNADLIAIGTHGPGVFERMVLGSVATSLLHLASVSVLAAPRPPAAEAARLALGVLGTIVSESPDEWTGILDAFSKRNSGRYVALEVDDPATGAQLQAHRYMLRGIVYDPRDRRVECMLGLPKASVAHLTRTIENVRSVAIYAKEGRDNALEIRHDHGHTLLLLGATPQVAESSMA